MKEPDCIDVVHKGFVRVETPTDKMISLDCMDCYETIKDGHYWYNTKKAEPMCIGCYDKKVAAPKLAKGAKGGKPKGRPRKRIDHTTTED